MKNGVKDQQASGRKRAEQALSTSEARYRRLFETAQDGILILDAHSGLITDVNPFLINLLDYSREEFIGKSLWEMGPFRNVEASKAAFRELPDKQYIRYEDLPLEARSGRRVNVEFVSNVYGVNGQSVIQCNIRDITARKHGEQLEERLRQSQKMEAVGQLAGGVAHDFNNLLGVILGYCDLLELQLAPDDAKRKMVEEIHSAGAHAATLTRQLLAFSRRQVLRPVVLDLNQLVAEMGTMLRRLIGEDIDVATVLLPDVGRIKADPTQIEQILINLALNGRDAMPHGGTITIETSNVELDESDARQHAGLKVGSYVMLAMTDTGVGMDSDTLARIFEPFFTTKKLGEGTGLGLSTVYGVVMQSDGYIWASSELGSGTTFRVYLPCVKEKAEIIGWKGKSEIRRGSETILLVEDNAPMRKLTREMLKGFGYVVLDAGRPSEAIRTAQQHEGPIALLITDVVMPETNGHALAEILTGIRPDMRVLYASGYNDRAVKEAGELEAEWPPLEKPFTRVGLAKTVRELLDSPMPLRAARSLPATDAT